MNREGPLRNDRRHEFKLYATYNIPVVDVNLNAIYQGLSGRNWFPYQQYSTAQTGFGLSSVGRRFYLEPRGTNRMPFQNKVDLRFDKQFRVSQRDRISVYLDINNVFNDDTILDYQDLAPSRTITGIGPIPVGAPASLAAARQITIGGRWAF